MLHYIITNSVYSAVIRSETRARELKKYISMHAAHYHSRESHVASMKTGAFYSQKSSLKQGDGGLRWHSQCSCCTENHENRFLLTHLAPLSPGNSREPWGFAYIRTGMRLILESRLDRPAHICTPITRDLTSRKVVMCGSIFNAGHIRAPPLA